MRAPAKEREKRNGGSLEGSSRSSYAPILLGRAALGEGLASSEPVRECLGERPKTIPERRITRMNAETAPRSLMSEASEFRRGPGCRFRVDLRDPLFRKDLCLLPRLTRPLRKIRLLGLRVDEMHLDHPL